MSTLTLEIGGVDYLPQYKTGSAKISSQLKNQGDTMEIILVQKSGQSIPSVGKEIIFKDGSRFLFGGFISRLTPVEYGVGQLIEYTVECQDYTYILVNKSVQQSYESQTLAYIVDDILSNHVDSGYGITDTNVATGPTIATINFNHISVRQAFENLSKLTGYIWWIDFEKDIHFIDPNTSMLSPESIRDSSPTNHENVTITVDLSQVRNDIIVIGGTTESANYTQIILGDANAREWLLLYPVQNMVSVELDTGGGYVAQTFGIDPRDDETLFYSMYSADRGSIRLSSGSSTLGATHKLRIIYTYPLPVLTQVKNATSITSMMALEGGDGLHSYTIEDATIVSQSQAQERALKELDDYANPTLSGRFSTRTGLLSAGSYFSPGQAITVNLPSWGITIDTVYVIQKVVTTLEESGSSIEYHYDVTFGGNLLGVVDFLQALATPETPFDVSESVQKIQSITETVNIIETITKNLNARTITETVTVSESVSKTNVTPPFKWGVDATANKGIWGKSEWA
jgi:prophage tail gpP-like protein